MIYKIVIINIPIQPIACKYFSTNSRFEISNNLILLYLNNTIYIR